MWMERKQCEEIAGRDWWYCSKRSSGWPKSVRAEESLEPAEEKILGQEDHSLFAKTLIRGICSKKSFWIG